MIIRILILLFLSMALAIGQEDSSEPLTDQQIKRLIIQQSIRSYSGSCPCPYNTDSAGRRCGGRSAYSRPGGASPICYEDQVSDSQVESYRRRSNTPTQE